MFTRTTALVIAPLWMLAMSWLIAHDVWPALVAEDPPTLQLTEWLTNEGRMTQHTIFDDSGPIGSIWTEYLIDPASIQRSDTIWFERLAPDLDIAPLRITVNSAFTADGQLDEFTLRLVNDQTRLQLHGERFYADFSFQLEIRGLPRQTFKIPLTEAGFVTGALNPFTNLSGLEVGRVWRIQVFNPLSAITGLGERFIPTLLSVTGKETIVADHGRTECFIVEAGKSKAWVDERGVVYRQEVQLPVIGNLRIVRDITFDVEARSAIRSKPF